MPKRGLPLTELRITIAKPREKSHKLSDGGGLYLEVTPVSTKLWRFDYTQANGQKNRIALGAYPAAPLGRCAKRAAVVCAMAVSEYAKLDLLMLFVAA